MGTGIIRPRIPGLHTDPHTTHRTPVGPLSHCESSHMHGPAMVKCIAKLAQAGTSERMSLRCPMR